MNKKRFLALVVAAVMVFTMLPQIALAAAYTPPADAPYGSGYRPGDNVPQDVIAKALAAVRKSTAENGMVGIPYSTYDCSDFVEEFLGSYVGFQKSSIQYFTAQNFYDAFKNTEGYMNIPSSAKGSDSACEAWLVANGILPGALLFFEDPSDGGHISHVGIYIGNGKIIDSISNGSNEGIKVRDFHVNVYDISHPEKGGIIGFANLTVEKNGTVEIVKTSANTAITNGNSNYSLQGAVFDIYNSAGERVGSITTDASGRGTLEEVPEGTGYYAVERTAPKGYQLDSSRHTFDVVADTTNIVNVSDTPITGNVKINKTSSNTGITNGNGNYSLQGAVYGIYNSAGQKVGTITTDANGSGTLDNLPLGNGYYALEETAPKGYAKDTERHSFNITSATQVPLNVSDKPQNDPIGMLLQKLDATTGQGIALGDGSLAEAEFTVKYYDGYYSSVAELNGKTPVRTWVFKTGANGRADFDKAHFVSGDPLYEASTGDLTAPLGTLVIQETKAPEGYFVSEEIYIRQITADGAAESVRTYNAPTVSEQEFYGKIKIMKVSTDQMKPSVVEAEPNAEFQLYISSAGSYDAASEAERDILTTDTNGEATSKDLPYGTYTLHQTKGRTGYYLATDMEISVTADGETVQRVLSNARKYMYLNIQKVDAETGKSIPAAGVVFKLKNSAGEFVSQDVRLPNGTVTFDEFETGADGIAQIPFLLPADEYTIVETAAPEGYLLGQELKFTLDTEEAGSEIIITVEYQNTPQKGRIRVIKTGDQFVGVTEKETEYGTVYAPIFENKQLAGATFDIVAAEDIVVGGDLKASAGDVVDTITTTADGEDWSKDLYLGKYNVVETETAEGYVLSADPVEVTLASDNQTEAIVYDTETFDNNWQKTSVSIYKEAEVLEFAEDGDLVSTVVRVNPGEGFTFGLFAAENFSLNGEVVIAEDNLVAIGDTDAEGKLTFDANVPHGAYYIKELATKDDYILSDATLDVDFTYQGQEIPEIKIDLSEEAILNVLDKAEMTITKKDVTGEETIPGATIEITDKETGEVVYRAVTDENGEIPDMVVLAGHSYTFKEVLAPEGFALNTATFEFTVEADGTITGDSEIRDDYSRFKLLKTEEDGKTPLAGATFAVFDAEGKELMRATSGLDGLVVFEPLPFGLLTIREIDTPAGWQVSPAEIYIMVDGTYENQEEAFVFPNKLIEIQTTATGKNGEKEVAATKEVTIIDTVAYENLTVGRLYHLVGVLMDKETGEELLVNGQPVTSEAYFMPETSSGTVEVIFTFDGSALLGKSVVVFETLYENGVEVAAHADIEDLGQTVTFVEVPKTGDNSNMLLWIGLALMAVLAATGAFFEKKKLDYISK